jgi:hypothetical protein
VCGECAWIVKRITRPTLFWDRPPQRFGTLHPPTPGLRALFIRRAHATELYLIEISSSGALLDDGQLVSAGATRRRGGRVSRHEDREALPAERAEAGDPGAAVALLEARLDDLGSHRRPGAPGEQVEVVVERIRRSFDGLGGDSTWLPGLFEETRDATDLSSGARLGWPPGGASEGRAVGPQRFSRNRQAVRGMVDRLDQPLVHFFGSTSHADLMCK